MFSFKVCEARSWTTSLDESDRIGIGIGPGVGTAYYGQLRLFCANWDRRVRGGVRIEKAYGLAARWQGPGTGLSMVLLSADIAQ